MFWLEKMAKALNEVDAVVMEQLTHAVVDGVCGQNPPSFSTISTVILFVQMLGWSLTENK